jgi:DNA-binding response OmpR family regulator
MATRILIIEDERPVSRTLVEVLQGAHYAVIPAYSGLEGFARLQTSSFDLVILDLKLPDVDGLDMLPQIQAALPKAKVLVLTSNLNQGVLEKAFKLGARCFQVKPVQPDEVLKLIPSLLNPGYQRRKVDSDLSNLSKLRISSFDSSWAE